MADDELSSALDALLRVLGRREARAAIDAFVARGAPALEAYLARRAEPWPEPEPGRAPVNGRAVWEDEEDLLKRLAAAHPRVLLEHVRAHPEALESFQLLAALTMVRAPEASERLYRALDHRSGTHRWLALRALLDRADPRVPPRLPALLSDRDHLVRFEAACAARRVGGVELLEPLASYAEGASVGGREAALDAMESICARTGAALPDVHPGARLERVDLAHLEATLGGEAELLDVSTALRVKEGDPLARMVGGDAPGAPVPAPCDGVIVDIVRDVHGHATEIVIRR